MLDRATRIRWTADVVAYLNGDNDGAYLGADPALAQYLTNRVGPPEKMRKEVENELRGFAEDLERVREKAIKEQWPEEDRAAIQIDKKTRHTHGDYWLDMEARERGNDASFIAALNYDQHGRIVMHPAADLQPVAMMALTLAELYAEDSPVEVKVCKYELCKRFFAHELHGARRPNEYCPGSGHDRKQRKLNEKYARNKLKTKRKKTK